MKKLFRLFTMGLLLSTLTLYSQVPKNFTYQAVARNNSGEAIANQNISFKISLLQGSTSGTSLYSETHSIQTDDYGIVNLAIGAGTKISGDFATINWASGPYFVKVEMDVTGGSSYVLMGASQLLGVPYALYAANAGTATGGGNFTHYIGEQFGGGVIFHLWKDNTGVEHGLIVALTDQSSSQAWSNVKSIAIGASARSSWDGLSNSNAIVGQVGHTSSAAQLCLDLVNGGQSDWYLPSVQELNMLWNNYYTVARALSQISGATQLTNNVYWSSSEASSVVAWQFFFDRGYAYDYFNKSNTHCVRAVRAF